MKIRNIAAVSFLGVMIISYSLFPIVAGFYQIGERNGPKVYFVSHHDILFSLGYNLNSRHTDKPRINIFLERPLFYGGKRGLRKEYESDPRAIEMLKVMESESRP